MEEYESLSLVDLRLLAKKRGIPKVTSFRKQELIAELKKTDAQKTEDAVKENSVMEKEQGKTGEPAKTAKLTNKRGSAENIRKPMNKRSSPMKTEAAATERKRPEGEKSEMEQLDSGNIRSGILEVLSEGYGFIRCDNYLPGEEDLYVSPALIRKYHLRTGDIVEGNVRVRNQNEKFGAILYIRKVNGYPLDVVMRRNRFEQLTPVFPDERIRLETPGSSISTRMLDLIAPIGKGQRGMIVSQPKTGKTTLLKQVAKAVKTNYPKMHILVLLIDERPEEVTDSKESILGTNV